MSTKPTYSQLEKKLQQLEKETIEYRNGKKLVADSFEELQKANRELQREIAERKRAEEELRDRTERLESLIKHSSLAIVTLNNEHKIVSCNPFFEELFQFKKTEIIGKNVDEILAGKNHKKDAGEITNKVLKGETIHAFGKRRKKDGTLMDVEIFGVPVIIEGEVIGVYGLYRDVSDLKRAEEAIKQSEERYRTLYEESKNAEEVYRSLLHSSADAIVIYDLEGRAQYISPAFTRLFGWSVEELKGKRVPFLPDSERERTMNYIRDIVEKDDSVHDVETKRFTKDGDLLEVSISASRYNDHEGKPAGMLVLLRDISEKKKLEAQLLQAHKMEAVGTLAGGVAHDFNNILQAISGYTQILLMGKEPGDPDYDKLESIVQSAERASDLTKRLLIFGRKLESKLKPVNLNQEVLQVRILLERTIPKMIDIELKLVENLKIVSADPLQLEQVMMNLAVNARDVMLEGGKITFETKNVTLDMAYCKSHPESIPGNYVLLKISDTGEGMDKEILERIFEPFFTTKELGRGTGLGLAMVYGIVKSHGGFITCHSEVGRGTTFEIYLPVLQASSEALKIEKERREKIPGGSETVLLVDDEPTVLEVLQDFLHRFGYKTLTTTSGEEALERYEIDEERIDLVILDLNMPGMGGNRCLEELLKLDPKAKVIISSGYTGGNEIDHLLLSGSAEFIAKPYHYEHLLRKIREVLDKEEK